MAKKKKGIAAAIEAAAKAAKNTATKAAVSSAAKQVKSTANKVAKKTGASTSSQSAAAVAAAKAAAEAAAKAAKQAAAKKAAAKTQEGLLKNTKALQTKKRGGVVLSNKTLQRKQAAQKARENALKYITKGTDKKSVKKAIQKGKKTSALGTEIKKVTKTYDTGAKTTNSIVTGASAVANIAKAPEEVSKLVSQGHSEEAARKAVNEAIKANVDATKVKLEKDNPSKIKYSYKNLTQGEYNLMAVAAQQGRLRELLQNNKTLANKVRKLNVKDYVDSPVVMGALDQLTQGLSVSQDPVYKYSKDEKRIMEKQKQTTGYNVGRVAGAVGEFALGGTSSMGSSLAKTAGKTALKEAAKQGGKSLAKTAAKNTAKDIGGDALASLGLNTLDALKFSYEDGKFNKKAFAKELALNVGGDMLLGGAVSGITHGLSANQVRRFNNINKKVINGADVSAVEMKFYNKHLDELIDKVSTKYEEVKEAPKQKPSSGNNIAEQRANELKAQGLSEDDVLETLASEGVSPVDASKAVGDDIEEDVVYVGNVTKERIKSKSTIGRLEAEIEGLDVEIKNLKQTQGNEAEISRLERQKQDVESKLVIENEAKKANNGLDFTEYVDNELKLQGLRKEYNELKYKMENTKSAEHYREYATRRVAIADALDDYYSKKGMKNIVTPTRKTVEAADDLSGVATGKYKEEVKTLEKSNRRTINGLYRTLVDTFHGFEQVARELPKENREVFRGQINALRNARNKAGGWISEARVSADGKITGKSFNDIIGDMLTPKKAKEYEDFQYYLANKHNIDRYAEGKGVFGDTITADESRDICAYLEKQYPSFAQKQREIVDYFKDLQKYRVDTGLISQTSADYLDALYPNYIPTYRVKDGNRVRIIEDGEKQIKMSSPIKTATGGTAEIKPLHEQVIDLTDYTLRLGEQNRLFNLVATLQGFDAKAIAPDVKLDDAVEACTFFTKETDGATNKYYTSFYDNGQLRKIQITEQMYLGMKEWNNDPDSLAATFNWKAKWTRKQNALFKNLITGWNPIFGVKNIVKDTGEALLYTKNVRGFIASYPKAIAAIVSKESKYRKYFDLYQAAGGKYAHIREDIATFNIDSTFKKIAKSPITVCQRFNDCLEAIPRMSEFISTIERSVDIDKMAKQNVDNILDSMDSKIINRAMLNANEITLNFGRSGVAGKALNSTVLPYFNPAIQGVDKLVRIFKEAKADGIKGMLSLCGKLSAFAIAPAMFNEIMMDIFGGQAYQNLNTRDKNNNYLIPIGDGKFIKIPKARVSSAVSAPFEHVYRHARYGDPMEWDEMFNTVWSNVGTVNPLENNLYSPLLAVFRNKTWYGGAIENAADLDLRATGRTSEIYDETTSAISIWIGKKTGISPKKIDYIIDGYTGVIGDFLIPATAEASSGNPLYKNFILDSVFSNKLSTQFWDMNASLEARSNVGIAKDKNKYENWKAEYMYDALTINQAIRDLDSDKKLTKAEKLAKKRELKKGLNRYYAAAVKNKKINIEPIQFIAKQIGAEKALTKYLPESKNKQYSFKEHFKNFKQTENFKDMTKAERAKASSEWLRTYSAAVLAQKSIDPKYHNTPDWTTIAIANAQLKGRDSIAKSCGVYDESIEKAKLYVEYSGSLKTWSTTQRAINKRLTKIENSGVNTSDNLFKKISNGIKALSLSKSTILFKDRAYFITGTDAAMNAARGLEKEYNWTINEIIELGYSADTDGNTYLKKQEIINAIESSKASTNKEKAMLFNLLAGDTLKNPYGSVGSYKVKGDTGIIEKYNKLTSSSSGGGSRSYSRSSKTSKATTEKAQKSTLPPWEEYVKDYVSNVEKVSGVNFKDWDSPLDKTYVNKINSILKKTEV